MVMGFLDDSVIKNPPANAGGTRESVSIPGSENQVEKEWQPIPIFLPGKFHGQRSLADYSPWGCKVRHN